MNRQTERRGWNRAELLLALQVLRDRVGDEELVLDDGEIEASVVIDEALDWVERATEFGRQPDRVLSNGDIRCSHCGFVENAICVRHNGRIAS